MKTVPFGIAASIALLPSAAYAGLFNSTSLTGSASASADTNIFAEAVGLDLTLDDLDIPTTTSNATGSATVNANSGGQTLQLTALDVTAEDIVVSGISDSDSDSILFGLTSADVSVDLNNFSLTNLSLSLVNPAAITSFAFNQGADTFTLSGAEVRITADTMIDANASLGVQVVGAEVFGTDIPVMETLSIDEIVTLPDLTFDTFLAGDVLTISAALNLADFLPEIDQLIQDEFGSGIDIINDDNNIDITFEEILALAEAAEIDLTEFEAVLGLVNTLDIFADIDAEASFQATFVIPTPGAFGLAAIAGVVAARRRRA